MKKIVVALALLTASTAALATPMNTKETKEFIEGGMPNCLKTGGKPTLCKCYMEAAAVLFTKEDMIYATLHPNEYANGFPPEIERRVIVPAIAECTAEKKWWQVWK